MIFSVILLDHSSVSLRLTACPSHAQVLAHGSLHGA